MIEVAVLAAVLMAGPNQIPDSEYRGKWYVPSAESWRKCIMWKESRGRYTTDSRNGSGGYQFIQPTWDHYAELAGHGEWVGIRPNKAPQAIQDAVFWRTYWKGKGKHHWKATSTGCK